VTEPLLHGAQIDASPQAPGGECRTELVQPEVVLLKLCPISNGFQAVEEIQLGVAPGGGKHKIASLLRLCLPRLQTFRQLRRDGNLSLLVRLRWTSKGISDFLILS